MSAPSSISAVRIRRATAADAPVCGRILYEAFAGINQQHGFAPEIPRREAADGIMTMLFGHPGFYTVVASVDDRIVGSNCMDERSAIAGIGPVSVDPTAQNSNVGRTLMRAMLERAAEQKFAGIRLVQAAFHGRSLSLYAKLGFDSREPLMVMAGSAAKHAPPGVTVRAAKHEDVAECSRLCERVHGFARTGELLEAIEQGRAVIAEQSGRIAGYAAGFGYFGHAVAESNRDLQALISSASEVSGPGILVPIRNADLFRWCLNCGLRVIQPMTLMTTGLYNVPAAPYLPSILF